MKQTVVILCNKLSETSWAIRYLKKNQQQEKIIILTPLLESQLLLKKSGIPYQELYKVENFDVNKDNYPRENTKNNIYKKALETITLIEKQTTNLKLDIFNHNIFKLLVNNLAFIYPDIFHAHTTYQNIIKRWQPVKIFVSANIQEEYVTGKIDEFFSLACYIKYYFRSQNIKILTYPSDMSKRVTNHTIREYFLLLSLIIQKIYYLLINFARPRNYFPFNKTPILMETGGIITSYYYKLYHLLLKKYNFVLITYKLQLKQEIPLLKQGIPYLQFNRFWKKKYNNRLIQQKQFLVNQIKKISLKHLSQIDNSNLKKAIFRQTRLFLISNLEETIKKVIIQKEILNKYKPQLVINSHDPSIFGASLVLPTKSLKIPTLLLLHGIFVEAYLPDSYSDYFAVWGPASKEYFSKYSNRDPKTIFAIGFPKFDELFQKNSKRFTNKSIKVGLILNSYFPNDSYQAKFFHELFSTVSKIKPKFVFNYRFHEGFTTEGIDKLAKEFYIKTFDKSSQSLDEFIEQNDLFISWDTSALLWIMQKEKPIIQCSPNWNKGISIDSSKYNASWIPKNAHDLKIMLVRFINNPRVYFELIKGQRKFIEDNVGPLNGKSSEKLLKLIDKLIIKKNI